MPMGAKACSCIAGQTVQDAFEGSDAIFTGTVRAITDPNTSGLYQSGADPVSVDIAVGEVFKGDVEEVQRVVTAADSAACGFSFAEGESYLVFATKPWEESADVGTARYQVDLCSMTQLLDGAGETLDELGEIATPSDPLPPSEAEDSPLLTLMQRLIDLLKELIAKL